MRLSLRLLCAATLATGIACGDMSTSAFGGDESSPPGSADGGGFAGTGDPSERGDQARGIVLAHAAVFPTMRLCFGAHMEMRPQPETTTMPQSNVVGIEIGNIARIAPMDELGDIYVIDESRVRPDANKTCAQWLCASGVACLRESSDFHKIPGPAGSVGQTNVDVLAISGCGSSFLVNLVGANAADCGASHDVLDGNLAAKKITLTRTGQPTSSNIPAFVVNLSERLETIRGTNTATVTFGELTGTANEIASNPPLFQISPASNLAVDQTQPSQFNSHGFKASVDGYGEVMRQTLASVQETSAPLDVPSSYFSVASNYALLLLGDPRIRTNDDAGAPNPTYDLRKGLHVIAVPVLDPNDADAGAGDGGTN